MVLRIGGESAGPVRIDFSDDAVQSIGRVLEPEPEREPEAEPEAEPVAEPESEPVAAPEPEPEAAPEPEPEAAPEPEPVAAPEPEPTTADEPAFFLEAVEEPVFAFEPVPEPVDEPVFAFEPIPDDEPAFALESAPEPEPAETPEPEPEPAEAPEPEPEPAGAPGPEPEPEPAPTSKKKSKKKSKRELKEAKKAAKKLAKASGEPKPAPEPEPEPVAALEPEPAPEPAVAPEPEPEPALPMPNTPNTPATSDAPVFHIPPTPTPTPSPSPTPALKAIPTPGLNATYTSSNWNVNDVTREAGRASALLHRVSESVGSAVCGRDGLVDLALLCMVARGNLLVEGLPGMGKATLLEALARATSCNLLRIRLSPDVTPAEIAERIEFDGVQTCIVLADEIDRASAKTQSALLDAMSPVQAGDGLSVSANKPLMLVATQSPADQFSAYPLAPSQADRFTAKAYVGYPKRNQEERALGEKATMTGSLSPVAAPGDIAAIAQLADRVLISDAVRSYIVDIVSATRVSSKVHSGVSLRGSIKLAALSRAYALYQGRGYVIVDDVKLLAKAALAHRLQLSHTAFVEETTADDVISYIVANMPVPQAGKQAGGSGAGGPGAGDVGAGSPGAGASDDSNSGIGNPDTGKADANRQA